MEKVIAGSSRRGLFATVLLLGMLAGCAGPTANVDSNYVITPDASTGLLVGSVEYRGPLSGYKVYYRGLDNAQQGYFEAGVGMMIIPIPPKSDFQDKKGTLQVVELPAGNYEIGNWSVKSGYATISQTQPFSIRFVIEPGKATYIGSFVFTATSTLGLTVTGVQVDFTEAFASDSAVLRERYPTLADTDIFMGVERDFVKKDVGGQGSLGWKILPLFMPIY